MVQSRAATVDDWFEGVDPARAPVLRAIRVVALRHFGAEAEAMRYGMPAYGDDPKGPAFAFNSQRQYISLYVSPNVNALHAAALAGVDVGKSCIRFRKPEAVDLDLLDLLLRDTVRLKQLSC
jgi:hypothetical protein